MVALRNFSIAEGTNKERVSVTHSNSIKVAIVDRRSRTTVLLFNTKETGGSRWSGPTNELLLESLGHVLFHRLGLCQGERVERSLGGVVPGRSSIAQSHGRCDGREALDALNTSMWSTYSGGMLGGSKARGLFMDVAWRWRLGFWHVLW